MCGHLLPRRSGTRGGRELGCLTYIDNASDVLHPLGMNRIRPEEMISVRDGLHPVPETISETVDVCDNVMEVDGGDERPKPKVNPNGFSSFRCQNGDKIKSA